MHGSDLPQSPPQAAIKLSLRGRDEPKLTAQRTHRPEGAFFPNSDRRCFGCRRLRVQFTRRSRPPNPISVLSKPPPHFLTLRRCRAFRSTPQRRAHTHTHGAHVRSLSSSSPGRTSSIFFFLNPAPTITPRFYCWICSLRFRSIAACFSRNRTYAFPASGRHCSPPPNTPPKPCFSTPTPSTPAGHAH
jgi:hypothetical protein